MSKKIFFKKEPFFEGFLSTFDLFGTHTFTIEDIDELIPKESEVEVKENDLEMVAQDFWNALVQYERKIKSTE